MSAPLPRICSQNCPRPLSHISHISYISHDSPPHIPWRPHARLGAGRGGLGCFFR